MSCVANTLTVSCVAKTCITASLPPPPRSAQTSPLNVSAALSPSGSELLTKYLTALSGDYFRSCASAPQPPPGAPTEDHGSAGDPGAMHAIEQRLRKYKAAVHAMSSL